MKKIIPLLLLLSGFLFSAAQGESESNSGSFMAWDLKIYVVLAVLFIILSFLFIFLFSIERRLKEAEQKVKS